MKDLFSLKGRTALVTGGSRGIGKMIAEGFLHHGAKVYISARKAGPCEETAKELSKLGTCIALPLDASGADGAKQDGGRAISSTKRRSTSSSTMPAPPGARRSTSFPKAAGTRSWTSTSRLPSFSRRRCTAR